MTSIRPFAAGTYATTRNTSQILTLKDQLDRLSTQLATGRTAETYGGLGSGRSTSLSARASLSALDGYDAGIGAAQTRVNAASASLGLITKSVSNLRASITTSLRDGITPQAAAQLGRTNLDAGLDALNQSVAGQYLFGGRASETEPVLSSDVILNGDPTVSPKQDGLVTLVAEQKAADLGPDGLGRLELGTVPAGGTAFSLTEDQDDATGESRANFGFGIPKRPTATGTGIAVTTTNAPATTTLTALSAAPAAGESFRVTLNLADGSQSTFDLTARDPIPAGSTDSFPVFTGPGAAAQAATALNAFASTQGGKVAGLQSQAGSTLSATFGGGAHAGYSINVTAQPAAGDSITVELALHDGTKASLTLTAQQNPAAGSTTAFKLGATREETAANLRASLETAIKAAAAGPLSASATMRASEDFFSGSSAAGQQPRRIAAGDPPTYKDAAASNTVIWYRGETGGTDPRETATVRAGANLDVAVGARANERPIQKALAAFAAIAVDTLAGPDGGQRYPAVATRAYDMLAESAEEPSLQTIATEFGIASSALANAATQNRAMRNTLQSSIQDIEVAPLEEVAASLLEVQNRLQASYQITASLSKLSLVNYIG